MAEQGNCYCGADDCWDQGDYSWLSSNSGWHGELHGCSVSIFFIHGKKIREQRSIPDGHWLLAQLPALLAKWSTGLPNARLVWCRDTGGGEAELWIEGEREPDVDDMARLDACRARKDREDRVEFKRLQRKFSQSDRAVGQTTENPT